MEDALRPGSAWQRTAQRPRQLASDFPGRKRSGMAIAEAGRFVLQQPRQRGGKRWIGRYGSPGTPSGGHSAILPMFVSSGSLIANSCSLLPLPAPCSLLSAPCSYAARSLRIPLTTRSAVRFTMKVTTKRTSPITNRTR